MSAGVDLRQLAVRRDAPAPRPRRHIVTRLVMPAAILAGFLALAGYALGAMTWLRSAPTVQRRTVVGPDVGVAA